jgi:SWI/SNF-related matrix-associated actin-dependent regulator of chromatin subfamily B protein 1
MNTDPPAVPSWLCAELDALRVTYPTSNINPVMMFSAVDAKTSVVLQLRSDLPAPTHPGVLYTYLPRIRCMDCPGKLYTPPMANFEIHLKNRWHKAAVAGGRGEEVV